MNRSEIRRIGGLAMTAACLLGSSVVLMGSTCGTRILGVCAEGATRCAVDAVETCTNGAWSIPVACAGGESCSLGSCSMVGNCLNDCAVMGATFCSGGSVVTCGEYDSDACLDLGSAVACNTGDFCSNGACSSTCTDECTASDVQCVGVSASSDCGNWDEDDCLDWAPPVACPSGQSCSAGSGGLGMCMMVSCMDECDPVTHPWTCASGGFTACVTDGDNDACYEEATLVCDVCSSGSYPQCSECCG